MNVKLLIDAIMRQTTVLIAQLSTTAGIRAPLAHVADQVFVELVKEIEAQGVGRKVVADMFGMALRSYQKKVQRLTESATLRDTTLWEAVLEFIQGNQGANRKRILERFKYDGEQNVAAVLNDLINSGMIYKTGRGANTVYGITSEEDYRQLLDQEKVESVSSLAWVKIYRASGAATRPLLLADIRVDTAIMDEALDILKAEGRIVEVPAEEEGGEATFRTGQLTVPVGSSYGWEAAVFDHFQAMVAAITVKLSRGGGRSSRDDVIGGATLSFDICEGHPYEEEVYGLLHSVRAQVNDLWTKVSEGNKENPIQDDLKTKVTFYFGQTVQGVGFEEEEE